MSLRSFGPIALLIAVALAFAVLRLLSKQPDQEVQAQLIDPAPIEEVSRVGIGPSQVEIVGEPYSFTYLVDGTPESIRGVGYKAAPRDFPASERARLFDWDFSLMRQNGINMIFGWDQHEYDGLLLDKAAQHGLGVGLPFWLEINAPYGQEDYQDAIIREVISWVEKYREHPALRMYAIGNE